MVEPVTRRALRWLFGDEGTVATESGLQVVVLATAMAVSGVYVMSPILSALTGPFGVTDARVGALITAYTAPSVVLVPAMGLLADRFGRRRLLVGGLLLFGFGGAGVSLTTDFGVALGLRGVQGVGFAAINPLGVTIIGDHFQGGREATAQGLRVAGIQTAALLTPPLAGVLVLGAWQYPFLFYGLAIPVAVWAWITLPDAAPATRGTGLGDYVRELVSLLRRPTLGAIQLSFVVRFSLSVGYYAFISVLLTRTLGASALETGLVVAGVGVLALASSTQVGRLVAARDPFLVLFVGLVAMGAGLAVMGLAPTPLTVGVGGALLGVGIGSSGPVQKSLVTRLAPAPLRAGAVSSALLFQSIGQAAGPLLLGGLVAVVAVDDAFVAFGLAGAAANAALVAAAYRFHRRAA